MEKNDTYHKALAYPISEKSRYSSGARLHDATVITAMKELIPYYTTNVKRNVY